MINFLNTDKKLGEFTFQKTAFSKINEIVDTVNQFDIKDDGFIDVRLFGANGDGISDSTSAFQSLISFLNSSTSRKVKIPAGRYIITKELIFPKNTIIQGDGLNISILDFSKGSPSNFQTYGAALNIVAAAPVFMSSAVIPLFGDITLTLNTASSVSENDVLMIWDSVPSSYSAFDTNYMQGELVDVSINSTSTVINLKGRIRAHLYQNQPSVYKMDPSYGSISDLGVISPLGVALLPYNAGVAPINFQYLTSGNITNVTANNSDYCGIILNKCYNISLTRNILNKNQYDTSGLSYGISISNCQKIIIRDSIISASRQAISTGGNQFFAIVCRDIYVDNCTLNSTGGIEAFGWHGNTEFSSITNSVINGGIIVAGRMNLVDHNTIIQADTGPGNGGNIQGNPIAFSGVLEPSITISNNKVLSYAKPNANAVWLQFNIDDNTTIPETLVISGNEFIFNNKYSTVTSFVGVSLNYTGSSTNNVSLNVFNNKFYNNDSLNTSNAFSGLRITGKATSIYDKALVRDNEFTNCNFISTFTNKTQIKNNEMHSPLTYGFNISNVTDLVCNYNEIYNYNFISSGGSTTDTAIYISTATKAECFNNSGYANASNLGRYGVSLNAVTTFNGANNNFTNLLLRVYNFATVTNANVLGIRFGPFTLNFPSTSAQTSSDLTASAPGAVPGDHVSILVPLASQLTNSFYEGICSTADQVVVRYHNYSAAAQDPASGSFYLILDKK